MQLVCKSAVSAVGQDAILGAADGERAAVSAAIGPHCVTSCVPAADPVGAVISHVTATKASVTPPHAFGGSCYLRQVGPLKDPQRSAGRALGDSWRLLAVSTVSGTYTLRVQAGSRRVLTSAFGCVCGAKPPPSGRL